MFFTKNAYFSFHPQLILKICTTYHVRIGGSTESHDTVESVRGAMTFKIQVSELNVNLNVYKSVYPPQVLYEVILRPRRLKELY